HRQGVRKTAAILTMNAHESPIRRLRRPCPQGHGRTRRDDQAARRGESRARQAQPATPRAETKGQAFGFGPLRPARPDLGAGRRFPGLSGDLGVGQPLADYLRRSHTKTVAIPKWLAVRALTAVESKH